MKTALLNTHATAATSRNLNTTATPTTATNCPLCKGTSGASGVKHSPFRGLGGFFFTLLLLLFATTNAWAQDLTDIMFAKGFGGYTTNGFSAAGTDRSGKANSTNKTDVEYSMQVFNGSTGAVRGNQSTLKNNFSCRNTTTKEGYYISQVSLTVSGGTIDGSTSGRSVVYFGETAFTTSPSGTPTNASPASSGQTTLTWTNTDTDVSYFILFGLKTSGTALSANETTSLKVVWSPAGCSGTENNLAFNNGTCTVENMIELSTLKKTGDNNVTPITYAFEGTVSNSDAEISDGIFYGYKLGTYTINATQAEGNGYCAGTAQFTVTVNAPEYTYTWMSNGMQHDKTSGSTVVLPSTNPAVPIGCEGAMFVGWTTEFSYSNATTAPTFVKAGDNVGSDKTFYAVFATEIDEGGSGTAQYEKVTSDQENWEGQYLIAYSDAIFMDGSLSGTDPGALNKKVAPESNLTGNNITATWGDTYCFTLEAVTGGYVLKSKAGSYLYQTTNANGIKATDNQSTAASYPITVTFTSASDIKLKLGGAAAGAVLCYNTSGYFRYYKNGGQSAIYLYKKSGGSSTTYSDYTTSCCTKPEFSISVANINVALTDAKNIYNFGSDFTINKGGSTGAITYSCADENVDIDGTNFYTETAGTYTITATLAADGNYCAATTTFTITVTDDCTMPSASFSTTAITKTFGDADFTNASLNNGGSAGTVTYSSTNEGVATVTDAGLVHIVGVGTTTITANIAAANNYCATTASYTLTVNKKQLATPTGLTSSDVTQTGATLSWTVVENATSYTVTILDADANEVPAENIIISGTTATVTGLTFNTTYTWSVTAVGNANYDKAESDDANFTTIDKTHYTITWNVNGSAYTTGNPTTDVVEGGSITVLPTAPTAPASCSTKTFMGWTTAAYEDETTAPAVLFKTLAEAPDGQKNNITSNKTFYAVFADVPDGGGSGGYEKVTTAPTDWSGEYLIVYEAGSLVFDGSLTAFDAAGNTKSVTITTDNTIEANTTNSAYQFTIATMEGGYSICGTSGKYIGHGSDANALTTSADALLNTLSINEDGSVNIICAGGAYLRYNNASNQTRFRYYKSGSYSGQQAIHLYKKSGGSATNYVTSCCENNANITFIGGEQTINLDQNNSATAQVSVSQTGQDDGSWDNSYTVSPTTANWNGTTFTAPAAGTYTLTATYTYNDCPKSASTTITVLATPVITLVQADPISLTAECGEKATAKITVSAYNCGSEKVKLAFDPETTCVTIAQANQSLTPDADGKVSQEITITYTASTNTANAGTVEYSGALKASCGTGEPASVTITATKSSTCNTTRVQFMYKDAELGASYDGYYGEAIDATAVTTAGEQAQAAVCTTPTTYTFVGWSSTLNEVTPVTPTDKTVSGSSKYYAYFSYVENGETKTTAKPVCGAYVQITNNREVYVTGGIGTHYNTVQAQATIDFVADALVKKTGATEDPLVRVLPADITVNGTQTTEIKVEQLEQTVTQNTDGTFKSVGKFIVKYTPTTAEQSVDVNVKLSVRNVDLASADAFTVHARSLPEQFVIVGQNNGNWYALPANMNAAGTYAGNTQLLLDDDNNPTVAEIAPNAAVYKFNAMPSTEFRYVRFLGNDNSQYLWASNGADGESTNIRNWATETPEYSKTHYNWLLTTTDNKTYTIHNQGNNRNLSILGTKFGMYIAGEGRDQLRILPITEICNYAPAPTNLAITNLGETSATATWDAISGVTKYEYQLNDGGWTTVSTNSATLALSKGNAYTLTVRAKLDGSNTCVDEATTTFTAMDYDIIILGECPVIIAQPGETKQATVDVSVANVTTLEAGSITGEHKNMFNVTAGVNGITVTFAPPTGTAEGDYTATVAITGTPGNRTETLTLHGRVQNTINMTITTNGTYCMDDGIENVEFTLKDANGNDWAAGDYFFKDGVGVTSADINCIFTDMTTGDDMTSEIVKYASFKWICISKKKLTLGHKYRFGVLNEDGSLTDAAGIPFASKGITFEARNCNEVTALAPCAVSQTSFDARWKCPTSTDGTTAKTLEVYTKTYAEYANVTAWSTTNVNNLQYAGDANLSGNYWISNINETKGGAPVFSNNRLLLSDVSTPEYYNVFSPLLSNFGTISSDITYTITIELYQSSANSGAGVDFYVMDNGSELAKATVPVITNKTVTIDGVSTTTKRLKKSSATDTYTFEVSGLDGNDRIRLLGYESGDIATKNANVYLSSILIKATANNSVSTQSVTCSNGDAGAAVTGLTANTTYYYTVDGTNEIAVTTRSAKPELNFELSKLTLQSSGACVLGKMYVTGKNLTACQSDFSWLLKGTDKDKFAGSGTNLSYNTVTGELGGYVDVRYCPTESGRDTAMLVLTVGSAQDSIVLEGLSCLDMADPTVTSGAIYATLTLPEKTSGVVALTDMGSTDNLLKNNPGFENTTQIWEPPTVSTNYHIQGATCSKNQNHTTGGSYSLYASNAVSAYTKINEKNYHPILFTTTPELTAGSTYAFSAWVYPTDDADFAIGYFDDVAESSAREYKVVTLKKNTWTQLSITFMAQKSDDLSDLFPFVARHHQGSNGFEPFYVDDVVLAQTSGSATETYMFSDTTTVTLDELTPGHNYQYYLTNTNTGCKYGPWEFATNDSTVNGEIIIDTPIELSVQASQSVTKMTMVDTKWLAQDVTITKGTEQLGGGVNDPCSWFTITPTTVDANGGMISVTFKPDINAVPGTQFTCPCTATSVDLHGSQVTTQFELIGTVTAGIDPSLPLVEVVDIDETTLVIEHNVAGVDSVQIVFSRELTEEEIQENVGCELFFSKYYEASSTVKLWAVYNPTNDTISLAGTYVWLGTNGNAWNKRCDLSQMGRHKTGYIAPQEELIVYASDGKGAILNCAAGKADMTNWYGLEPANENALSFDGNDALVLVRSSVNDRYSSPDEPFRYVIDEGKPTQHDTTLNWRWYDSYQHDPEEMYQMLDLIGARTASNVVDNSKCTTPKFEDGQSGDEEGWVTADGADMNGKRPIVLSTNRCLLVRDKKVKAGSAAVMDNFGDFITLGSEWQGSHVPASSNKDAEDSISCENFSYVGTFDYASYYATYTELGPDAFTLTLQERDSTYIAENFESLTEYTCKKLLIECVAVNNVNGTEVKSLVTSSEYKVPIIVNTDMNTNHEKFTQFTVDTCKECDVVILDNAKLTREVNSDSKKDRAQFRNMSVFTGGSLYIPANTELTVNHLEMRATNDTVSYAIVDGTLNVTGDLVHQKRIDAKYWYSFSLPYDCNISAIRQFNGKSLGTYEEDWLIRYYDGAARAEDGTWDANGGYNGKTYWKDMDARGTLKANQAYLIALGGNNRGVRLKSVYFPPLKQDAAYTESGADAVTLNVTAYTGASTAIAGHENDKGWNFIGHPYISVFNHTKDGVSGTNNDLVKMGLWDGAKYTETDKVYVNIPKSGVSDYDQDLAANLQMSPFQGHFVQVAGESNATLSFQKGGRDWEKAAAPMRAAAQEEHAEVSLALVDANGNLDRTGILVDEVYCDTYEPARDLTKMSKKTPTDKPYLSSYITDGTEQELVFNALPSNSAHCIPLRVYAPTAGEYTFTIDRSRSDLSGVTAVLLHAEGDVVADLLAGDYTLTTKRAKQTFNKVYSITVERKAQVTTDVTFNGFDVVSPVLYTEGLHLRVEQLPQSGELHLVDAVGRVIETRKLTGASACDLQVQAAGVYMVIVRNAEQTFTLRTIAQ